MPIRLLRAPLTWVVLAVLAVGAATALYWFQPWKLVTDTEVHEELVAVPTATPASTPASTPAPASTPTPAGPVLVGSGAFVSHEHETRGTARIVRTVDGRHRLELVGLNTSNGPDLQVWLTDQPVRTGPSGWHVFDDGRHVALGPLKGNRGDQAYAIPAGTDLTGLTSVSIWCERFAVSFGAAALAASG
ncbi:DM13 domain-containing protein [Micromonospora sp. WMMA1998]|uniref:DM13 domain-containing protein n=1 Tax=Micromonospora sp. WMMA1998 TaxID=3015167 RepID=UPI00248B9B0D|nr:DM13 domain-containing protein [Micromonospora sp. WMMA1998]WBC17916.1 DM13 domain-containing protein [Micromonospora sp. WMMA1998]